jgi:exosortase A
MASIVGPRAAAAARPAGRLMPVVAAALACIAILLVHVETVRSAVAIWLRSETFTHGFVVVPIALWLAWRERRSLAALPARPFPAALAVVALAAAAWLAASLADIQVGRQLAVMVMVQAAIVATLGLAIARAAALPLAFLLFAVPAGEFLLPTMIDWTADFTVTALQLSGVPVFREANHFVIPSGAWSVVEACSGLRYLIASLMIGVVFAEVTYRSRWRKLAFVVASIAVPIVANWLRAYMIVMLGHLSDNRLAVGVDHLIYGWVFFGIVMAVLFWIGSLWTEKRVGDADDSKAPIVVATPRGTTFSFAATAGTAVVIATAAMAAGERLEAGERLPPPTLTPINAPAGFRSVDAPFAGWQPGFRNESAKLRQGFVLDGLPVGLHVVAYVNQSKGRELVTSTNQLVLASDFTWREIERRAVAVRFDGRPGTAQRSVLSGDRSRIVVAWTYWIDGHVTANPVVAKAWLAWTRLRGRPDIAALVAVSVPEREGRDAATQAMEALAPAIGEALRAAGDAS